MTVTRQRNTENDKANGNATTPDADLVSAQPLQCSTAAIKSILQPRKVTGNRPKLAPPATKQETTEQVEASFILIDPEYQPPAAVYDSILLHTQIISDNKKNELGVKTSSHTVEIVTCNDCACDIIFSPVNPHELDLNKLPGSGKSCYLFTPDKKMYYADKQFKRCMPIAISAQKVDDLCSKIEIALPEQHLHNNYICLREKLNDNHLKSITDLTRHLHNMGYYKQNPVNSVMSPLEAANSTAYQLLGPRHFPTCFAVQNSNNQYIGVVSKSLPGFKPNRDKPLQLQDLEISSLKNMIKRRDEGDINTLKQVFQKIEQLIPLMERKVDWSSGYIYPFWERAKNCLNSYVGDPHCAVQAKPKFEAFLKDNLHSVTFGRLDELRQLLVSRKDNIIKSEGSYVAQQHQHKDELPLLDEIIDQLSAILLDENALYIKHINKIIRGLQEKWVDLEAEIANPKSQYANIEIFDGLTTKLSISLTDISHYLNNRGLGIGLPSRYFMQDPDGHAKNLSPNGCNVDGDLAVYPLTYRFKKSRKPAPNDFSLTQEDYVGFPNLKNAYFRYWPTQVTGADTSIDTTLSIACDMTQNYFKEVDSINYQALEKFPVFNFQKYVQLIILSLTNKNMYTACAKLHMTGQLHMLNEDGDVTKPLPLKNESGQKQDVRTLWVECLNNRALEARELAKNLPLLKKMLERHSDLILEMIQDHFSLFLHDRAMELNKEAFSSLEKTMTPEIIQASFLQFKEITLLAGFENIKIEPLDTIKLVV